MTARPLTPAAAARLNQSAWAMVVPGWHPAPLNELLGHWSNEHHHKQHDRQIIGNAQLAYGVPPARGKRRVGLVLVYPKGERMCDPDAYHKSLLDALVACGLLKNDSRQWVEISQPVQCRGTERLAVVTLEEVS